jgi:molybdopterin-containing oxidoreductase family membrane subunit
MQGIKRSLWIGILSLGVLAGLLTAYKVFTTGLVVYAKTNILVWTMPLASYVFFSLTSSGLAFVSSIPIVFGIKRYGPIEKRTIFLEISVLIAAFVCLVLHLGSPLSAIYFLLSPNPASPLWWLGILYGIYLVILVTTFWRMHTAVHSKALGVFVFLIGIATSTMLGWLFGHPDGRPAFNAPYLTMYFPLTALASGLAAVSLVGSLGCHFACDTMSEDRATLYEDIAKLFGIVIAITLLFFLWRSVTGGVSATALQFGGFRRMLHSRSHHIALWLGFIVPLLLMALRSVRSTTWGKATASSLFLIGMFAERLGFLLSGEVMPMGPMAEGQPQFVSYAPTIWEVFVPTSALSVMLLLYTLGEWYLNLEGPVNK